MPGRVDPLHVVQDPLSLIQPWVRDNLQCQAGRQPEAHGPVTFGDLGDGLDGAAGPAALYVAFIELEKALFRHGKLASAAWETRRLGIGNSTVRSGKSFSEA